MDGVIGFVIGVVVAVIVGGYVVIRWIEKALQR